MTLRAASNLAVTIRVWRGLARFGVVVLLVTYALRTFESDCRWLCVALFIAHRNRELKICNAACVEFSDGLINSCHRIHRLPYQLCNDGRARQLARRFPRIKRPRPSRPFLSPFA